MDANEGISPAARAGIVLTGALQGLMCWLISWYIGYASLPADNLWLLCVVPATLMVSTTFALCVTSYRQPLMWLALLVILAAVAGMGGWLRWTLYEKEIWSVREELLIFGFQLLLMCLLMLPWLQRRFDRPTEAAFYADFYSRNWHNALTLVIVFVSNGLVWLVLFLWAELFRLVGIELFQTLFFDSGWFIAVAIGLVCACAIVLARTRRGLIQALQNLLTLIATALLPLVAVLALIFIVVLPFVGLTAISARVSAAGLLLTLAILLLLLVAVVWHPQRGALPWNAPVRAPIRAALIVLPLYPLLAAWALWLRIAQYGWTPQRLYGVLITIVVLVWAIGFCISVLYPRRDPRAVQGAVTPGVGLLSLLLLILINTPILDPWRISVASHMARYQSGAIKADRVSLYMLSQTGREGHEALVALQKDPQFMANPERRREINALLSKTKGGAQPVSAAALARWVELVPGTPRPDAGLWQEMVKQSYRFESCAWTAGSCLLTMLDLNGDAKAEAVVYQFSDRAIMVYTQRPGGWTLAGDAWKMPEKLTRQALDRALQQGGVKAVAKPWADISLFGERIEVNYNASPTGQ